jgi:dihydroorotate dehydrogenase
MTAPMAFSAPIRLAYRLTRPLFFRYEAERIHVLTVRAIREAGGNPIGRSLLRFGGDVPARPPVTVAGLTFRNRVGIGAGFDKDGVALRGLAALGAGFVEVGTVTPEPQAGNPRPRLFRLTPDEALVNRMGFNNDGAAAAARNVMLDRRYLPEGFVVGVNIGRNRATPPERAVDDYIAAYRLVAPVADFVVVNVSSPNTPGLRDLQDPELLLPLLDGLAEAGERLGVSRPIFVKVAPDLEPAALSALVTRLASGPTSGVVVANTTIERDGLRSGPLAGEPGGLSGRPLLPRTLSRLVTVRQAVGDRLAVIASGGIHSGRDAQAALAAGADLVELWTGLIYQGPSLVGDVVRAVSRGS